MKKNRIIIVAMLLLLMSCSAPLARRMDDYVDKVESDCRNWSEEDWELSQIEYSKLLDEYERNYDSYSQEEKDAINKAIGRYTGLIVKQGIDDAASIFREIGERLPSIIEGFVSAFDSCDSDD